MSSHEENEIKTTFEDNDLYCPFCDGRERVEMASPSDDHKKCSCPKCGRNFLLPLTDEDTEGFRIYRSELKAAKEACSIRGVKVTISNEEHFASSDVQYRYYKISRATSCFTQYSDRARSLENEIEVLGENPSSEVYPMDADGCAWREELQAMKKKWRASQRTSAIVIASIVAVILVGLFAVMMIPKTTMNLWEADGISVVGLNSFAQDLRIRNSELKVGRIERGDAVYAAVSDALKDTCNAFEIYDVSIVKRVGAVKLHNSMTVTMPVPEDYRCQNLVFYRYNEKIGALEPIDVNIHEWNRRFSFETDSVGIFITASRPFAVTFDANGGTPAEPQKVLSGDLAAAPSNVVRAGYTLTGWYYEDTLWSFSEDTVSQNMHLVAEWTPNTYTVEYQTNGGALDVDLSLSEKVLFDSEIVLAVPQRRGYSFGGWYDGEILVENGTWSIDRDVILTARWIPNAYIVKYDPNGGTGEMDKLSCTYDKAEALPENAYTREGYSFLGWSLDQNATIATYPNGAEILNVTDEKDREIVLYALWKANTYKITFDTAGGDPIPEEAYGFGTLTTLTVPSERVGYTFGGWEYDRANFALGDKMPAENIKATAIWIPCAYHVIYHENKPGSASEEMLLIPAEEDWEYDADITLADAPVLKGWTFEGWYKDAALTQKLGDAGETLEKPNLATEGTITLYAKWTPNTYQLLYQSNQPSGVETEVTSMPSAENCYYDANVTLGAAPTLEGYTFDGWYIDPQCTQKAGNAGEILTKPNFAVNGIFILYAKWTQNPPAT